ncbi:hypothetical protein MKW98_008834 [Papaver atlanticum]|uniref:BSD domain-containing protein n=1 Tax=Papaver atlanticum TaxID=357466 RepID=A0AAD4S793_9MAGN|nr:hypothetical protein MKW98_008834 [Papaver atlanticum]
MSWFSSLTNQFNQESESDSEVEEDLSQQLHHIQLNSPSGGHDGDPDSGGGGGGVKVKENLTEIRKSIGRQLLGVASFLAPPPQSSSSSTATTATTSDSSSSTATTTTDSSSSSHSLVGGIKSDFAEISGSLKSGLSLFSSNKAVNEISRFATTLLQFPKEDGEDEVAGVNQEVLEFVRIMSSRPECWTEFPLPLHHYKDFHMSEAQEHHASTIEELAPSLADLRYKLCPNFMTEDRFWMIYFIMLYPRLRESDAMLLTTPQIVEVKKVLLQNLQNKSDAALQGSISEVDDVEGSNMDSNNRGEFGTVLQKKVLAESTCQENVDEQENVDQWLEEEDVETGTSLASLKQLGNDEDVSFSDLEDDDNDASTSPAHKAQNAQGCSPSNSNDWFQLSENSASTSPTRKAENAQDGSPSNSGDWVQLSENSDNGNASRSRAAGSTIREKDSEGEESNDWLNIDDFYADSVGNQGRP